MQKTRTHRFINTDVMTAALKDYQDGVPTLDIITTHDINPSSLYRQIHLREIPTRTPGKSLTRRKWWCLHCGDKTRWNVNFCNEEHAASYLQENGRKDSYGFDIFCKICDKQLPGNHKVFCSMTCTRVELAEKAEQRKKEAKEAKKARYVHEYGSYHPRPRLPLYSKDKIEDLKRRVLADRTFVNVAIAEGMSRKSLIGLLNRNGFNLKVACNEPHLSGKKYAKASRPTSLPEDGDQPGRRHFG